MNMKMRLSIVAVVGLAATGAGCGNSAGLSRVDGKVLYKGEPAAGARVYFQRTDATDPNGTVPTAQVGDDGRFQLTSGEQGSGAAPGVYNVLVEWRGGPPRTHRDDLAKAVGKTAVRGAKLELKADDRLQGRYFDPAHPRLHAEVASGSTSLPTFELND